MASAQWLMHRERERERERECVCVCVCAASQFCSVLWYLYSPGCVPVCGQPKGIKLKITEYKLRKMARSITAKRSQTSVKKGTTQTGMSLWRNSPYFKQRQEISCIPTGHLQCCIHMYPPPSSCGLRTLVNACTIKHHHSCLLHIIFFCTLLNPF